MENQFLFSLSLLAVLLIYSTITTTQAQSLAPALPPALPPAPPLVSPPAPPLAPTPGPPGPTNITKILEKDGRFTTLIRLLRLTQMGDRINIQLNDSNQGITLLAPTDSAFSRLSTGTLNSLTDNQKSQLLQFHVISSFVSIPQFQTLSNPVRTEAGDTSKYGFPLNVTSFGNTVNISTGLVNASVANTIYTDNQLAVYEVDKVLLPLNIFGPQAPAPAPTPVKPKKKSPTAKGPSSDTTLDASGAVGPIVYVHGSVMVSIGLIAAFCFRL